jgi:NDP-sugar pyrophosphorylase family protein
MHIVIPMAGVGQRFIDAGYKEPKPLIKINNKTIIEHACDIFPSETKFTFICNAKHLAETNMREELLKIKPDANILEIPNHTKGPVYTVLQISDLIDDDEEVIINYCDFGIYWDYKDFLKHTRDRNADGAIVSYKKFHPHMFGSTNYALSTDNEQWLEEIKEKEPIDKEMNKYVSNGTYYFKRGRDLKKYSKELMDKKITYNDEYYVSLVYNLLVKDNLKVSIYDIPHMLQWGIPEDVERYNRWSNYFESLVEPTNEIPVKANSLKVVSLLDDSLEFEKVGFKEYADSKPFMEISGKPIFTQVIDSTPPCEKELFLIKEKHLENNALKEKILSEYPNASLLCVNNDIVLNDADEASSIFYTPYDKAIVYDKEKYKQLLDDKKIDIVIFTYNGKSFGTCYIRNLEIFNTIASKLEEKELITLLESEYNYIVKEFEVSYLIPWDTAYNYETYIYWQSFFHKVEWHPYTLENDRMINKEKIEALDKEFRSFEQEFR